MAQSQNDGNSSNAKIQKVGSPNLAMYGLVGSVGVLAAFLLAPLSSALQNASSASTFYLFYGSVAVAAAACAALLSVPSFKKNSYPNMLGLVSLIINVFTTALSLYLLVSYYAASGGGH